MVFSCGFSCISFTIEVFNPFHVLIDTYWYIFACGVAVQVIHHFFYFFLTFYNWFKWYSYMSCKISYLAWDKSLYCIVILYCQYFLPVCGLPFIFLMVSFDEKKLLILRKFKLLIFSFMVIVFCILIRNFAYSKITITLFGFLLEVSYL